MTVGADQDDFRAPKGEKTFEGSLSCNNVKFLSGHLFKEPCARRPMPWHHACGRHPRHNVFLAFVYITWSTPTDSSAESVLGTTTSKLTVKLRSLHMCCTLAAFVGLCFTQSCCETAIWLWSQRRNQLQNPLQLSNRWHQAGQAKQRWSLNGSMVRKSAKAKSRNSRCNGRGEGTIQQLDVVHVWISVAVFSHNIYYTVIIYLPPCKLVVLCLLTHITSMLAAKCCSPLVQQHSSILIQKHPICLVSNIAHGTTLQAIDQA